MCGEKGGPLLVARATASASRLADGRLLIAGGHNVTTSHPTQPAVFSVTTSAEIYDPATGLWSPTGSLATARSTKAVALSDGRVLFAGGIGDGFVSLGSAEIYEP